VTFFVKANDHHCSFEKLYLFLLTSEEPFCAQTASRKGQTVLQVVFPQKTETQLDGIIFLKLGY